MFHPVQESLVTCVTAHWAAAIAVLATVAALTLLPSVRNTSLKWKRKELTLSSGDLHFKTDLLATRKYIALLYLWLLCLTIFAPLDSNWINAPVLCALLLCFPLQWVSPHRLEPLANSTIIAFPSIVREGWRACKI